MDRKLFGKALALGLIPGTAGAALAGGHSAIILISDGCCSAALVLGVWGLWRLVRRLHFFDGVIYSFARLRAVTRKAERMSADDHSHSRPEYVRDHSYEKPHREILLAAGIWLMAASAAAIIC